MSRSTTGIAPYGRCVLHLAALVVLTLAVVAPANTLGDTGAEPGAPDNTNTLTGSTTIQYVGSLIFSDNSVLSMQIGGTEPGSGHDQLVTSGTIYANGTLQVELINGYQPLLGDTFDLFEGNLTGQFDTVATPTLSSGMSWDTSTLYSSGTITAVPEPSTIAALVGVGGIGLVFLWRRRRRAASAPPPTDDSNGPENYFEE